MSGGALFYFVPGAFAVPTAVLVLGFRRRNLLAAATGVVALVSIGATFAAQAWGGLTAAGAVFGLLETATLLLLMNRVARWCALWPAVAALVVASLALTGVMIRIVEPATVTRALLVLAYWFLGGILAVGVGVHLRSVDVRWAQSVAAKRRAERLELARDLHDFVAHDVSGMVVQAQAARIVAGQPAQLLETLDRIEQGGQRALAAMDRAVAMLRTGPENAALGPPARSTLDDLVPLLDRFAAEGTANVHVDIDDVTAPGEIAATAYRVVTESLTNVRRHAPAESRVEVSLTRRAAESPLGPTLVVAVTNNAAGAPRRPGLSPGLHRHGGLGLLGLAERVEALGGTLHAGPCGPAGWRVVAALPLPPDTGAP
ncbi:sensor histidine kinase [Actinocrispum wychmicini]|nr:histidine kinase [Actinocrispum wychmicini]